MRVPSGQQRPNLVNLRLSDEELRQLDQVVAAEALTRAHVIRRLLLKDLRRRSANKKAEG